LASSPVSLARHNDREWLWASGFLSALLGGLAVWLMTSLPFDGLPDPVASLTSWFAWTLFALGFSIIFYTIGMMRAGNQAPVRTLMENWRAGRRRYAIIVAGMLLAGLDMYFYMIVKPELNLLFPFWADPHLANFDAWMLGRDGWRFFSSWNLELVSWLYSPFWFFSVLLTFYWLMLKPPSLTKSAAIGAYFAIWSIFGTIAQALFSSGGPVFYQRLGFGARFDAMPVPPLERTIADYLWHSYSQHSLAPGAGISAMPSLHIATMTWIVLSFAAFRSRLTVPAAMLSAFIYMGSVALGWHYATDGLAGAAGAVGCFFLSRRFFVRHESQAGQQLIEQQA
jgi:hypothetical protein